MCGLSCALKEWEHERKEKANANERRKYQRNIVTERAVVRCVHPSFRPSLLAVGAFRGLQSWSCGAAGGRLLLPATCYQ